MVKIGINGFGRVGRLLLKIAIDKCKQKSAGDVPRVVMINDAKLPTECIAYLIRNDSFYSKKCSCDIIEMGSSLMIEGQRVELAREPVTEKIPWTKCRAEYIIDTTGQNITCNKASKYLTAGVKRVIVTGCANIPMFVVGVNHCCYDLEMKIVSAATPSMNCLATMLRVLHENFQVEEAMATALHPLSTDDKILDDISSRGCRNSRSAINSFSPTEPTTSRKYVDKIMPELERRTESAAIKIPVPCVGAIDLTVKLGKEAPYEMIKCKLKEASHTYMAGIMRLTDQDVISTDLIGDSHSCIIDAKAGVPFSKCTTKIFAWYDSEYAFAHRLYDLAKYIASREDCGK